MSSASGPFAADCRLFVYGTLAPGQANHALLEKIPGDWQEGVISGALYPEGVGPTEGYPVVILTDPGSPVPGFLFTSAELPRYWKSLDEFEGDGYKRATTCVTTQDGECIEACIYVLNMDS